MSLFKGKKKKIHQKKSSNILKTTIDNRHNKKMSEIDTFSNTLSEKTKLLNNINIELESFRNKSMNTLSDNEIKTKLNLQEKKDNLEKDINNIRQNNLKNQYILETSHLLYEYFNDNTVYNVSDNISNSNCNKTTVLDFFKSNKVSKSKKKETNQNIKSDFSSKNDIMNEYLKLTDSNYVKHINNISNDELDNCIECGVSRIRDTIHGCMICPKCGCEEKILIDCDTPSYKEPPRELTYFAYKKINHANEWLSQFQAKESTDINEEIFDKILKELKKESYINLKHLTVERVRDILKKLDLTKYYEHCHYITNRITGKPAPVITGELEDKVRNMFKEIQGPWMKYCPSDRSNFFSYPYIFYKFFQLLDKDDYLPYCRLLKSREKLQEHDEVWKLICADLKWQYIPTV
tara:strand:- start:5911 stop:7128 length:1218 start_codon:yes stop_codon:yes gene_type:complete